MREAYILGFRFRYLNEKKQRKHFFHKTGSATRDGVVLNGEHPIFYRDIYKVSVHRNRVIISMMPFATTTREISDYLIDRYNCVMLAVENDVMAEKIKSVIDQRCTTMLAEDRWGDIPKEIRLKEFKRIHCPTCDALHDLTDLIHTNLVYCKYCTSIFDHFGYILPGSEGYKICPNCEYYGRVRDYWQYDVYYILKESQFEGRRRHYCDTCLHRHFIENGWKNLTFGIGAIVSLWEKLRSTQGRNPFYKELVQANYLAQTGKMQEADILFSSISFRNDGDPGIHMNYGLAYLQNGDRARAAYQFKKALTACSNYLPVLHILRRHTDIDINDLQSLGEQEDKEKA